MKQLNEFENWAENVISNSLFEKKEAIDKVRREIPKSKDIFYQASRQHPELDPQQALGLFLNDKIEDFDRRDLEQNKIINRQRQENDKLKNSIASLKQELDSVESSSRESDAEIEQLKRLSGKISTDVSAQKASAAEIQKAIRAAEELRNKEGLSDKQVENLNKKIEDLKNQKVNPEEFQKFSSELQALSQKNTVDQVEFARLQSMLSQVETGTRDVLAGRQEISQRIAELERSEQEQREILDQEREQIKKELDAAKKAWRQDPGAQKYRKAVTARSKQAHTKINNFLEKDLPTITQSINSSIENTNKLTQDVSTLKKTANELQQAVANIQAGAEEVGQLKFPKKQHQLPPTYQQQREKLSKGLAGLAANDETSGEDYRSGTQTESKKEINKMNNIINEAEKLSIGEIISIIKDFSDSIYLEWMNEYQIRKVLRKFSAQDAKDVIFGLVYNHWKLYKSFPGDYDPLNDAEFYREVIKELRRRENENDDDEDYSTRTGQLFENNLDKKLTIKIEESLDSLIGSQVASWIK